MSLVDDQIRKEEKYNVLDELGKRVNKVRDVSVGINEIIKFENALEKGRQLTTQTGPSKSEDSIDSAKLASDIMNDMER